MNKLIILLSLVFLIIETVTASSESSEDSTFVQWYCQTELAIKEKSFEIDNPENGFQMLIDNVETVNCDTVLEKLKKKIYSDIKKEEKKKKTPKKAVECNLKKLQELGYEKLRFKINSLLGLNLANDKKAELRKLVNEEIGNVIKQSVDECWSDDANEPAKNKDDSSSESRE